MKWKRTKLGTELKVGDITILCLEDNLTNHCDGVVRINPPTLGRVELSGFQARDLFLRKYREWLAEQVKAVGGVDLGIKDLLMGKKIDTEKSMDDGYLPHQHGAGYRQALVDLIEELSELGVS